MNPIKINKIIKSSGLPMCIDSLSEKCDAEIRHKDVVMSDNFFYCAHCGVKRHYVKKLSFKGKISLLFRKKGGGSFL